MKYIAPFVYPVVALYFVGAVLIYNGCAHNTETPFVLGWLCIAVGGIVIIFTPRHIPR